MLVMDIQRRNWKLLLFLCLGGTAAIVLVLVIALLALRSGRPTVVVVPPSSSHDPGGSPPPSSQPGDQPNDPSVVSAPGMPLHPQPAPTAPTPTLPPIDLAEVAMKYQDAVVWFGVEGKSYRFPCCTGWAVKPDTVVCTADLLAELKGLQDSGQGLKVFVHSDRQPDRSLYVRSFRLHPKYNVGDPGTTPVGITTSASPSWMVFFLATAASPRTNNCGARSVVIRP